MKVTVLNKKTLTIIGLIAMLVIAAVINVSVKGNKTQTTGDVTEDGPQAEATSEVQTASSISSSKALAQYELERQKSINEELSYLDDLINSEASDQETVKVASQQKMLVMKNLNTEKTIAEILIAKGFDGVTVVCGSETVNIIVSGSVLDDSKVAQILDITTSETDISPENIKIIPLD